MKKKYKILVGTHNKGKYRELSLLLPKKFNKISPQKLKIPSPKETGKTLTANSKLKAIFFNKKSKIPAISDDSGLYVSCMNGKPGIYSARWAKKYGGFKNAMNKIIKLVNLKNKKKRTKNTRAKFICSLSFKEDKKKCVNALGVIHGNISEKIKGTKGFGYDSIFIPKNKTKTFGEMSSLQKYKIDHRFIAFKKIKKFL